MQLEDSVEAVRVVRDSKTRIGKGIAYVLFKSKVSALAALQLNGSECKGRQMRVSRVEKSPAKMSSKGTVKGSKKVKAGSRYEKDKKSDGTFHWQYTSLQPGNPTLELNPGNQTLAACPCPCRYGCQHRIHNRETR